MDIVITSSSFLQQKIFFVRNLPLISRVLHQCKLIMSESNNWFYYRPRNMTAIPTSGFVAIIAFSDIEFVCLIDSTSLVGIF